MTGFASGGIIPPGAGPTYEDIASMMAQMPRLKRRELHCAADVVDALRFASAEPEPDVAGLPASLGHLTGIDVITDPKFEPGTWELRENGEKVTGGRLTQ